jgi:predicted SnoaL-like aldol condensation-catalyzing enzyme
MSVEENKAVVRRWNEEAISGQHLELFDELPHPDYANRSGTESPWATGIQGLDQAKSSFGEMLRTTPTFKAVIEDIIAEGDKVAIRMTFYEEGKPIANAMTFYRLSDGKIVDDWYCHTRLEQ